jgi:hypothetical protein
VKLNKKQKQELSKFSDLELCQELCDRLGYEVDNDGQVVIYTGFNEVED